MLTKLPGWRLAALVVILLPCLSLGADWPWCSGKTLVIATAAVVSQLDPGKVTDMAQARILNGVFETLVRPGRAVGTVMPGLAREWSCSADGRIWTFKLRPGITFHDGTPLTATSVANSMRRLYDPRVTASYSSLSEYRAFIAFFGGQRYLLRNVQAKDKYTVEFQLLRPMDNFAELMAYPAMAIVAPVMVAHPESNGCVGTGPFRLVELRPGQRVLLKSYAAYWQGKPAVENLYFIAMPAAASRERELRRQNVDIALELSCSASSLAQLTTRVAKRDVTLFTAPSLGYNGLIVNSSCRPFSDIRARLALQYAVEKEALAQAWGGRVAHSVISPDSWAYYSWPNKLRYDPVKSKRLLARVLSIREEPIELLYENGLAADEPSGGLAPALALGLRTSGWRVKLQAVTREELQRRLVLGSYCLALVQEELPMVDPDISFSLSWSRLPGPDGAGNIARFSSDRLQDLIDMAKTGKERRDRLAAYHKAQMLLAQGAAAVPLFWTRPWHAYNYHVRNLQMDRMGMINYVQVDRR